MRYKLFAPMISVLALTSLTLATPTLAAPYSNKVKVVGNSVTIKSSGGVTVVQSSNSCSPGISGYLFQSIIVLFGGSTVVNVTQSNTCP